MLEQKGVHYHAFLSLVYNYRWNKTSKVFPYLLAEYSVLFQAVFVELFHVR